MSNYRQFYRVKGLSVSSDGQDVKRDYDNNSSCLPTKTTHNLEIKIDKDGNKYVSTKDHDKLMIDLLVATCFCHKPKEGGYNYIIHLDKNKLNCDKSNLKWATITEYNAHYYALNAEWLPAAKDLWVSRNGEVKDGSDKLLTIGESIFDSDTDQEIAIDPYIQYYQKNKYGRTDMTRIHVEDMVAKVFCKVPNDITNPAILHLDGNYKNNQATNLKWVDGSSPEYQDYVNKRKIAIDARKKELNK